MMRRIAFLLFGLLLLVPAHAVTVKSISAVDGVQVWLSEDHGSEVIALKASFPAGSSYDPSARPGMAALAAYLLNEGAGDLRADAFQSALATRGIHLEASVSRDYMTVTLVTMSTNAKEAFRLLALALNKPRFDADAVGRVRGQMLQGIELGREDPNVVAEQGFHSLYFGPYTYGRPVDGTPRGLGAIHPQDLRAFAQAHWVRGGAKVSVAGDVTETDLADYLDAAMGKLPEKAPPVPPRPVRTGAPGLHILPMDVPQPAVVFGQAGLMRNDRDFLPALVANYILGGAGSGSRLTRELREQRGLTYDVVTDLVPNRRAGVLMGSVSTRRDAVRQTITVLRETMRRFANEGPTERELADAKQYLNGSFPLAFTSNLDIAAQLNAFQQLGLPLDYLDKRARLINAVTMGDVRRVARRLFDPSRMTIVVAGSLPTGNTEPADSP